MIDDSLDWAALAFILGSNEVVRAANKIYDVIFEIFFIILKVSFKLF